MKHYVGTALVAGAGILTIGVADAATAPATPESPQELQEVTITGSRLIIDGADSPTPLTTVTVEQVQATHASTVFQALLDLPDLAGSPGPQTANPGGGGANNNNISALNLHGIGAIRTLTVWDGHRLGPTQQNGFVNANMIPQMLLQRVDLVTGGASAVYGSDAMGGVVNFITDTKFNGLKVELKGGATQAQRDPNVHGGGAWGTSLFGGRGHFEGSVSTDNQDGIMHRQDVAQWQPRWTLQGLGTPASPYYLVGNAVISTYSFGGKITGSAPAGRTNPLLNQTFNSNGVLSAFSNGVATPNSSIQIGGDGAYINSPSLVARESLQQVFGRFDYDLTDALHWNLFATASIDHTFNWWLNNNSVMTLSTSNAFLPAAYASQLQGAQLTTFNLSKYWEGYGHGLPQASTDFYQKNLIASTGLDGGLGKFKWDAAYTFTVAKVDSRINNAIDNAHFSAALDAVNVNGSPVCYVSTTSAASQFPGCVPLNVFGPTSESQAAVDYVMSKQYVKLNLPTHDVTANISGPLFEGWAGPISGALSTDYRHLGYTLYSTAQPAVLRSLDCAGLSLRFNCTQGATALYGAGATAPRPTVTMRVVEEALEFNVPLLKDLPFARDVNLDLAGRHAGYVASGSPTIGAANDDHKYISNTWKLAMTWHFNDQWTLRATRSRDFRSPTLNDLFAPQTVSNGTNGFPDALNETFPFATGASGGNPFLKPETSYTGTAGIVFKPNDSFNVALDGYAIQIQDAIANVAGTGRPVQQACYASGGTSQSNNPANNPFCNLIVRNAAGVITQFITANTNAALLKTWGADVEVNYRTNLRGHAFSARLLGGWQPHVFSYQPGLPRNDYAATVNGNPANGTQESGKFRYTGFLHYGISENWWVDWSSRWHSGLHNSTNETVFDTESSTTPAVAYSNVTLTHDFGARPWGQVNAFVNIMNVFNQQAPITAFAGAQGQPGLFGGGSTNDDPLGRIFNVGVRLKL